MGHSPQKSPATPSLPPHFSSFLLAPPAKTVVPTLPKAEATAGHDGFPNGPGNAALLLRFLLFQHRRGGASTTSGIASAPVAPNRACPLFKVNKRTTTEPHTGRSVRRRFRPTCYNGLKSLVGAGWGWPFPMAARSGHRHALCFPQQAAKRNRGKRGSNSAPECKQCANDVHGSGRSGNVAFSKRCRKHRPTSSFGLN